MNPAKLESALRALYQAGLGIGPVLSITRHFGLKDSEVKLWEQAMQAAKECLEPEPEICGAVEGKSCCKRKRGHEGWHVDGIMSWRSAFLSSRDDDERKGDENHSRPNPPGPRRASCAAHPAANQKAMTSQIDIEYSPKVLALEKELRDTKLELKKTTKIALEALKRLHEIEEVYQPREDAPQWRWEGSGEPIANVNKFPKGLLP